MMRRNRLAFVAVPLLAFTVSCSSVVDTVRQYLPSDASGGETAAVPPAVGAEQTLETPAPPIDVPIIGISPRSTPDHPWAETIVDGGVVSVSYGVATMGTHFHFEVPDPSGPMRFIGYRIDDQFHLRAALCPNCGSRDIDFDANALVCPSCDESFDLRTGSAIIGSQDYPVGSIPVSVVGDYLTSLLHSLTVAYERTVSGEETLYQGPAAPDCITGRGCGR